MLQLIRDFTLVHPSLLPTIQNGTLSLLSGSLVTGFADSSTASRVANMISKIMANTPMETDIAQSFVGSALTGMGSVLLQDLVSGMLNFAQN